MLRCSTIVSNEKALASVPTAQAYSWCALSCLSGRSSASRLLQQEASLSAGSNSMSLLRSDTTKYRSHCKTSRLHGRWRISTLVSGASSKLVCTQVPASHATCAQTHSNSWNTAPASAFSSCRDWSHLQRRDWYWLAARCKTQHRKSTRVSYPYTDWWV